MHPFRLAAAIGTTGSPVPCQRLRRAHATYTPGTARATSRLLPGSRPATLGAPLSRDHPQAPVSMPPLFLTMRQQWFTHVRLLVTHLTR